MCSGCISSGATLAMQGSAAVVIAQGSLRRLWSWHGGQDAFARRRAIYQANCDFLASMGLDPERVLGPPPVIPADTPSKDGIDGTLGTRPTRGVQ